jgi:hypothetical protein
MREKERGRKETQRSAEKSIELKKKVRKLVQRKSYKMRKRENEKDKD